jgi:hypothetical protein
MSGKFILPKRASNIDLSLPDKEVPVLPEEERFPGALYLRLTANDKSV